VPNTKTQRRSFPIAYKLAATVSLLLAITLGLLWLILDTNLDHLLRKQTDDFGHSMVQRVADSSAELILTDDLLSLSVMLGNLVEDPNILSAAIYDVENKLIAEAGSPITPHLTIAGEFKPNDALKETGIYSESVTVQDVVAGHARVMLDKTPITQTIRQIIKVISVATIGMVAIGICCALALARHFTHPIRQLTRGAQAISKGHYKYRVETDRHDELGILINNFNEMAKGLHERHQIEQTFSRFMAPHVAKDILSDLDRPRVPSEYVNASILFLDIVSFTALCSSMRPQEVAELLNQYYFYIHQASKLYNGTVDKFIGDGAMIVFGAPQRDEDHRFHAICCAQLFLGLIKEINKQRQQEQLPTIQFRLGLHCGDVLSGVIGSMERMEYTVVGDTVNLAAHLCEEGEAGKLLITDDVYQYANINKRILASDPLHRMIQGKSEPITTYEVIGVRASYQSLIDRQVEQLMSMEMDT